MTMRFCPKCNQDVEATSGYCLLGHRLALDPLIASIGELRDEVDQAFEEADLEVAAVAAGGPATAPTAAPTTASAGVSDAPARPRRTGPPPPPPRRSPAPASGAPASTNVTPPSATVTPAPSPSLDPGPGAVPTAEELVARKASVWKGLDADIDLVGDPIGAFAPPPTMDWGPSKGRLLQRRVTRGKRSKRTEPTEPSEPTKRADDSQE